MWLWQSVISQMQVEKYVLDEQVHLGVSRQNQVKYTGMLLFEAPFSSTPVWSISVKPSGELSVFGTFI